MSNINALYLQAVHADLTFKTELHKEKKNQLCSKVLLSHRNSEKNELVRYRTFWKAIKKY